MGTTGTQIRREILTSKAIQRIGSHRSSEHLILEGSWGFVVVQTLNSGVVSLPAPNGLTLHLWFSYLFHPRCLNCFYSRFPVSSLSPKYNKRKGYHETAETAWNTDITLKKKVALYTRGNKKRVLIVSLHRQNPSSREHPEEDPYLQDGNIMNLLKKSSFIHFCEASSLQKKKSATPTMTYCQRLSLPPGPGYWLQEIAQGQISLSKLLLGSYRRLAQSHSLHKEDLKCKKRDHIIIQLPISDTTSSFLLHST